MHHFSYRDGVLHAEGVSLERIAREVGTPVYVYSTATLERHYRLFAEAVGAPRHRVFYAMKANGNLAVLRVLARQGAGADTVSEGEIRKARAAGIPASAIVLSGVGKTRRELEYAVGEGIYQINIETEGELELLARIAKAAGKRPAAALRVNPDVGAGGNADITTGSEANKFGVSLAEVPRLFARARELGGVRLCGLAVHIGSLILELGDMERAFTRLRDLAIELGRAGHPIERIDLGGGLGIPYRMGESFDYGPDLIRSYARMVERVLGDLDVERGFEPGRVIVGNAGVLLSEVIGHNRRPSRTFLVVDAAMNDLARPAMYKSYHEIWPVRRPAAGTERVRYDVVGPVCETTDTFARDRELPPLEAGALIVFKSAGAYGAVMASTYNARLLVPEVLVDGDRYAVVRPRRTYDDLIAEDRLPPWL